MKLIALLTLLALPALAAPGEKCVGARPCRACKNCSTCDHCTPRVNGKALRGKAFLHLREKFCGKCEPVTIGKV